MSADRTLRAQHVSHEWQDRLQTTQALHDLTAEFASGTAHFLCGPSGAGKSTLGLLLAGLITPTDGHVELDGIVVTKHRDRIAYLFQFPETIFFADSVQKELEQISPKRDRNEWESAFERVGVRLSEIEQRHPYTLSEGYARLAALAMQFARRPNVLILDEPTIGLDWKHQQRVIRALHDWIDPGRILIVITHDLDLMRELHGMTCVLISGRSNWNGSTGDLLENDALLKATALRA